MGYVLIIGARSDIAKAVARKYAESGYDLYLAARNHTELAEFASDLRIRTKREVVAVELDILDYTSHRPFYVGLPEKPEGVVSAVGYLGDQVKGQNDFGESRKIIETNYTGIASLLNIVADDMESRREGFIIGISSVAGDRGRKSNYLYGSAKAAFTAYLSGLRNRLAAAGVHVLTVKPGFVKTGMTVGMNLPARLTALPSEVADDIYQAQQNHKNILYSKWFWRWLMLIIKAIPEWKFKRMDL
jgi:short-subunit dehydrogenase